MDIDNRKIKILEAIIDDYINTAEPVGSRTIAKKYNLGISPATIRNEMADLEDMGYIEQLHSSSGRKPSDKGYRLYVDKLMVKKELSSKEEDTIKGSLIDDALYEVDKIIKQAAELLSDLTKLTCMVNAPSPKKSSIKSIRLVNIDGYNALTIIVTDTGIIKDYVIHSSKKLNTDVLAKISNILNEKLYNLTVEEINSKIIENIKKDFAGYDDIFDDVFSTLYDGLNKVDEVEIYLEGTSNIFDYPEFNDVGKAKDFLSFMDNKRSILSVLNKDADMNLDMDVSIGTENMFDEVKDCSIISAAYKAGNKQLGSIGIIGPTRMPYSKVISIFKETVDTINDILSKEYDDGE